MATVGDLMQSLRREAGDHPPDPVLALDWLAGRYAEALERAPWQFLSKEASFNTTDVIDAGTVTVTKGSTTVSETTTNANGWTSAVETRYFRRIGDTEFYQISTFTNGTPDTLTLDRAYEGATATARTYDIWERYYSLASDVRHVVSMFHTDKQLLEISQTDLDIGFPNRPTLAAPVYWGMAGRDSGNITQVEVYPIPEDAVGIYYRYIHTTPSLANGSTTILPQVPLALLRAGWLADYWGWRGAFNDGPNGAVQQSLRYESEFQKRMQEMLTREVLALPPKRVRFASRLVKHRVYNKFSSTSNLTLP